MGGAGIEEAELRADGEGADSCSLDLRQLRKGRTRLLVWNEGISAAGRKRRDTRIRDKWKRDVTCASLIAKQKCNLSIALWANSAHLAEARVPRRRHDRNRSIVEVSPSRSCSRETAPFSPKRQRATAARRS